MVKSEYWLVSGAAPSYVNGLEFIKFILLFFSSLQFFVALLSPAFPTVTFIVFFRYFNLRLKHPIEVNPQQRIPIPSDPVAGSIIFDPHLVSLL